MNALAEKALNKEGDGDNQRKKVKLAQRRMRHFTDNYCVDWDGLHDPMTNILWKDIQSGFSYCYH